MAIVMQLTWDGVTEDQYDQVRAEVRWEEEAPRGGIFHVAWFENGSLRAVDAWERAEDFNDFAATRLMAGVAKVGIEGEPQISIQPLHRLFSPALGGGRS